MLWFLDWTWLLLIPGIILAIWARSYVTKTYNKYVKVPASSGATGGRFAAVMLRQNGVENVSVVPCQGTLSDHFNPRNNTVSLSEDVYSRPSVASVAIAAHECGHVLQHKDGYVPVKIRTAMVPVVSVISNLCFPLLFIGIIAAYTPIIAIAAWIYFGICMFQVVTLPVELNASSRALSNIKASGVLTGDEVKGAEKMLKAAAMTYIASLVVTLLQFLRLMSYARRR